MILVFHLEWIKIDEICNTYVQNCSSESYMQKVPDLVKLSNVRIHKSVIKVAKWRNLKQRESTV